MTRALAALSLLLFLVDCGHGSPPAQCPQLACKAACPSGTRTDDATGCPSCLCAGGQATDGGACAAIACSGTCGLGNAKDPSGCDTCACCNPADCVDPNACRGVGADGCPTCYTCR
ncbi:MAG TPA: hypothetical protein VFF06_22385 [Polyangia bacterium]|nr:hypothetical protein [Polyangia bacterium]